MMNESLQKMVAWLVVILVIVVSSLGAAGHYLQGVRAQVDVLYTGGEGGRGVAYELAQVAANGQNLSTLAARYLQPDDPFLLQLEARLHELEAATARGAQAQAAYQLQEAAELLYDHLGALSLDEHDAAYRVACLANIKSHHATIAASPYNGRAAAFNTMLKAFPARQISAIMRVQPLELYM